MTGFYHQATLYPPCTWWSESSPYPILIDLPAYRCIGTRVCVIHLPYVVWTSSISPFYRIAIFNFIWMGWTTQKFWSVVGFFFFLFKTFIFHLGYKKRAHCVLPTISSAFWKMHYSNLCCFKIIHINEFCKQKNSVSNVFYNSFLTNMRFS